MEPATPDEPSPAEHPDAATAQLGIPLAAETSRTDRVFAWIDSHFHLLAPLVFLLLALIVFGDMLVQNQKIVGVSDIELMTVPCYTFLDREFHQGNLPMWNPHCFSGTPLAGDLNLGIFYPLSWFHYVMLLVRAINLMIALHVFLAGWFMALWCRQRRLSTVSCIFAGVVYMFERIFAHMMPGHVGIIVSYPMIPLIFLGIDGLFDAITWRQRLGWLLVGTLGLGLQVLSAYAQLIYYTAVMAGLYSLLRFVSSYVSSWWENRHSERHGFPLATTSETADESPVPPSPTSALRQRAIPRPVVALLLCGALYVAGPAIGAMQLLPGLAMSHESNRAGGVSEQFADDCSVPPEMLLSIVAPNFWGDGQRRHPYIGTQYFWELSLFMGCSTLLLALYGAIAGDWKKRRFTGSLLVVVFVLALGKYVPGLFHILFKYFPGYASVRTPSRWNELFALFMAMLAALGLDRLVRRRSVPLWPAIVGAVAAGALLLLSDQLKATADSPHGLWAATVNAVKGMHPKGDEMSDVLANATATFVASMGMYAGRQLLLAAITLGAAAGIVFLARLWPRCLYLLLLIAMVEMAVFARHTRVTSPPDAALPAYWAQARATFAQNNPAQNVPRFYHRDVAFANLGMLVNYDDLYGYDPICTLRYAQFLAKLSGMNPGEVDFPQGPDVLEVDMPTSQRFRRLVLKVRTATPMDISYLGIRAPLNALPFLQMLRCGLVMQLSQQGLTPPALVIDPLPRALLMHNWKVIADPHQRLAELTSVAFDPHDQVILEGPPSIDIAPDPSYACDHPFANVVHSSTDWLEIEADTSGGLLLITDPYANGWHVTPIGPAPQSDYPVMPANHILRAIPLKAGHHHFRLQYTPPGYTAGKYITLLAILAWLGGAGWLLWSRENRRSHTRNFGVIGDW